MTKKIPDFTESNRPRHQALEQFQRLAKEPNRAKGFRDYTGGLSVATSTPRGPKTLIDLYLDGDVRQVYTDACSRREHYSDRQHAILGALMSSQDLNPPIRDDEKNELLVTFLRSTEADKKLRDVNSKITQQDNDTVFEDGRALSDVVRDEAAAASFEKQDFGEKIII